MLKLARLAAPQSRSSTVCSAIALQRCAATEAEGAGWSPPGKRRSTPAGRPQGRVDGAARGKSCLTDQEVGSGFMSSTPVFPAQPHRALDAVLADLMDDISPLSPSFLPLPGLTAAQHGRSLRLDIPKAEKEPWCPAEPFFTPSKATGPTQQQHDEGEEETEIESDERRRHTCPSPRWDHTLCLSDSDTAILIGGEGAGSGYSKDGLWRLEIDDGDIFWFPLETTSTLSIPIPQCVRGHSATYDPDAKIIYIFGGKKDGECFNNVYILDTLTWKWSVVIGKGKVPSLSYHSAAVFQQELFIFGGCLFTPHQGGQIYSNSLYIFNREHEIWYQPIVMGDRPLPRCGHSATLLNDKLILFGGSRSRVFLNDLHILDLGFMEYVHVQIPGPPAPRCRHAALPVGDNKVLISGGYNLAGALQDVFIFNADTYSWSSLYHHTLCSVPRAGHSLVYLSSSQSSTGTCLKLLVFGGSNSTGQFYNDTLHVTLELSEECPENAHP
ncbi:ras guanine nucleotide exchange factor F isoform X2 [Leucoraja erinacea]|uniref:ras guanine nucleotide exchange factor F isoform X2 n=1 Tax=Leucoraja erinaceus TaxID=7782 RepID=UPI0024579AEB|nr:ras guanine nucleotide exchange factor F isoform X2 [Leucoraja erinacea]